MTWYLRHIDAHKDELMETLKGNNYIGSLLELTEAFVPVLESSARAAAPLGAMARIRAALDTLHHVTKARVYIIFLSYIPSLFIFFLIQIIL